MMKNMKQMLDLSDTADQDAVAASIFEDQTAVLNISLQVRPQYWTFHRFFLFIKHIELLCVTLCHGYKCFIIIIWGRFPQSATDNRLRRG